MQKKNGGDVGYGGCGDSSGDGGGDIVIAVVMMAELW